MKWSSTPLFYSEGNILNIPNVQCGILCHFMKKKKLLHFGLEVCNIQIGEEATKGWKSGTEKKHLEEHIASTKGWLATGQRYGLGFWKIIVEKTSVLELKRRSSLQICLKILKRFQNTVTPCGDRGIGWVDWRLEFTRPIWDAIKAKSHFYPFALSLGFACSCEGKG